MNGRGAEGRSGADGRSLADLCRELDAVTAHVFESMMALACEPLEPGDEQYGDVCARVQFVGALQGCCVVMLRAAGVVALVRAMLDRDVAADDALGLDAVRELCNMIAGGWKSGLPPEACAAGMTPPMNYVAADPTENSTPATVARRYLFAGNLLDVELRLSSAAA